MYTKTKLIFNLSLAFFAALLLIFPQSIIARGGSSRGRSSARGSRATPRASRTTGRSARGRRSGGSRATPRASRTTVRRAGGRRSGGSRATTRGSRTTVRSAGGRRSGGSRATLRGSRTVRSAGRHRSSGRRHTPSHFRHRGRSSLGLSFGFSDRYYYTNSSYWVSGHYETRTERVLVEPAHYETQTEYVEVEPGRHELRQVPAVKRTFQDKDGKSRTVIVEPARTEKVWIPPKFEEHQVEILIPDRYETSEIRTWIPGYWAYSPAYAPSRSWFSIGGRFRF